MEADNAYFGRHTIACLIRNFNLKLSFSKCKFEFRIYIRYFSSIKPSLIFLKCRH
jgi:hypothetical protein